MDHLKVVCTISGIDNSSLHQFPKYYPNSTDISLSECSCSIIQCNYTC